MEKVYFTKEISSESLVRIFNKLEKKLEGNVAVKISTGEPGGHNFLDANLIKDLVNKIGGTIVECNTAYEGGRFRTTDHYEVMKDHGFSAIAKCEILDGDSDMEIPVNKGSHLQGKNIVGSALEKYDSMLMLSHFKGHIMGGFGGALKNMSIGLASTRGKAWIHSSGATTDTDEMHDYFVKQNEFLESMAEACCAIEDYLGKENLVYINVLNNLSIDCDCSPNPADPCMADIGIVASLDPVALDQASLDLVMASSDTGKKALLERVENKNGAGVIVHAENLGLGSRQYELVDID